MHEILILPEAATTSITREMFSRNWHDFRHATRKYFHRRAAVEEEGFCLDFNLT